MEHCRNCNEPLTGQYCSRCGQRERGGDIQLSELAGEAFEELGQLDGRIWRTLIGLVIHPGRVTADYLAGHRARYIPPLRLYLAVSFLVFLVMSLAPVDGVISVDYDVDPASVDEPGRGLSVPVERADGSREVLTLREYLQEEAAPESPGIFGGAVETLPWLKRWLHRLEENAGKIEQQPGQFMDLLVQRLPQMMFFLLPVFALLLKLNYLFTPYHYLQHFIFSLHYHTAAFLLFILLWPAKLLLPGDFGGLVMLFLLVYLPIALVRVYGSGKLAAVAKGLVIGVSYYLIVLGVGAVYLVINLAFL